MDHNRDTVFALSSGRPPAAIAVVRISGPQTGVALEALIGRRPKPRRATLARVWDPENGEIIDEGLVLWFPGPTSATGEDVAELYLHGGRAVVTAALGALGRIPGCRAAEPGEFTRRAFDNGKLDLTRVEGLADLIAADTEAQRRQAFRHLRGWLGERVEAWRTSLIGALALVEARIDFADEGDVPEDLVAPALASARSLREEIAAALADERRGERLREGVVVAIAGPPNAGKSSLLNRIARRDAAIVSPYPGTTRDVIEVHLDLGGAPVTLLDTAGIRDSDDPVEQEGVRRAQARAAQADLVLWVVDATDKEAFSGQMEGGNEPPRAGGATVRDAGLPRETGAVPTWVVRNKIDLVAGLGKTSVTIIKADQEDAFPLSARTGEGLAELIGALEAFAADFLGSAAEPALVTRARHRDALQETVTALDRALGVAAAGREEIIAEELRLAARALGRLVGRVDVEDVLDVIFRDFCIGK